ncbi:MAG: RNA polymerase sigma factor [Acidobacteria bacterium]|nr:RNA polymerase sigma factor [Acidobacteriota bacterium]
MAEHGEIASEEDLVDAFRRDGDEMAFRDLFRRHSPTMYALARRMLGRVGGEAEDAVQEAWVRAAGALATFSWRSSLRTWLVGITINCCREILRVRSPRFQLAAEPEPLAGAAGAAGAATTAERLDLERAIERLPDGYRAVLVLHDIEGLTHAEIAGRLGIDPGTSKSQLSRARRALRMFWSAPSLTARS